MCQLVTLNVISIELLSFLIGDEMITGDVLGATRWKTLFDEK